MRCEPKAAELCFSFARPFARLAGADLQLLTITSQMAERLVQLRPQHAPYVSDVQLVYVPSASLFEYIKWLFESCYWYRFV